MNPSTKIVFYESLSGDQATDLKAKIEKKKNLYIVVLFVSRSSLAGIFF